MKQWQGAIIISELLLEVCKRGSHFLLYVVMQPIHQWEETIYKMSVYRIIYNYLL